MEHARARIISIGDELTIGATLDTNAQRLARALTDAGLRIDGHITVPDDIEAISEAIFSGTQAADLIVTTGGLGPTADDLTRQALAQAAGAPLIEDEQAVAQIQAFFQGAGRQMPDQNKVQALRPECATSLTNERGTAPGLHVPREVLGADVFCLPGPPREMVPMLEAFVLPAISTSRVVRSRVLRCFGIGESVLAERLGDLMDRGRNPLVGTTASDAIVSIRIRYEGTDPRADDLVDEAARRSAQRAGFYVFGDGDATLAGAVLDLLIERDQTVATVESCTGGMISQLLTDMPGSSAAMLGGWVTYTNELKQSQVGVPAEVFTHHGAVSQACAVAMADGGRQRSGAAHALAVTGIAGPGGGTIDKPVGTVWIALSSKDAPTEARLFRFTGERDHVRRRTAMTALGMLRLRLIGEDADLPWQQ